MIHCFRKPSASEDDLEGEEEFYYNEIEVPVSASTLQDTVVLLGGLPSQSSCRITTVGQVNSRGNILSTSAPASAMAAAAAILQSLPSNLADHMDMARPPHENPEYNFATHHSGNLEVRAASGGQASSMNPRPSPAHHQPRRPMPPPPAQAHAATQPAFSSLTAAVPIAIPVTNFTAFARSAVII